MVEVTSKGSFLSINVVCHPTVEGEEEEATLDPTYTVGWALLAGSRITTAVALGVGGVLGRVSSGPLGGWSVWRGFLRLREARGGCSLSWGCYCCATGWPPGKNRSVVIFLRTTISSLAFSTSAPKESTDYTSSCLAIRASIRCSSIGVCSAQPWKIVSADPSIVGTNKPTLISRGSRSRASPIVNLGGKKPQCRTST